MQVSEIAAGEWATEKQLQNFHDGGAVRSRKRTSRRARGICTARCCTGRRRATPAPFALAEYNAGASRAQRWAGGDGKQKIAAREFQRTIDFPGTKKIRGVDSRALPISTSGAGGCSRQGRVIRRRRKSCARAVDCDFGFDRLDVSASRRFGSTVSGRPSREVGGLFDGVLDVGGGRDSCDRSE